MPFSSVTRPRTRVLALLFGLALLLSFSVVPSALGEGHGWPNDPCPEGHEPVAKYEFSDSGEVQFEKGDDVVTFSEITTDDDGEATGFDWDSGETVIDSLVLKGGERADETMTGGATSGSVDFGTSPALSNVVFCAATADEQEPGAISAAVTKANDANQDESFSDEETANELDQDVGFHVEVTNDGDVAVSIASLTDTFPRGDGSVTIDLLAGTGTQDGTTITSSTCDDLDGTELESGTSADCTFTLDGYAPDTAPGSRTNTVEVAVDEVEGDRDDTAQDDSTVLTEEAGEGDEQSLAVDLVKANDANGDTTFSDSETAGELDQDVEFQVEVENTGDVAVTVTALTDTFPRGDGSATIDLLAGEGSQDGTTISASTCDQLDGVTLETDATETCTFTLDGYAPETAPDSRTNTVEVAVDEVEGDRDDAAQDDSTVRTEQVAGGGDEPTLAVDVDKANDADGDTTFSDDEVANELDQDVTFQVEIENTGDVAVTVTALTDTFPRGDDSVTIDLLDTDAEQNDGTTFVDNACEGADDAAISSGDTFTCTYTLDGYAPATAPDSRTNTVDVAVDEVEGDRDDAAQDDSTVRTEPEEPADEDEPAEEDEEPDVGGGDTTPSELSVVVDKTNDADGDTTFSDSETAEGLDQDVEFQVEVTNDGDETVTVSELTDTFERDGEDVVVDLLSDETPQDGATLATNTCAGLDAVALVVAEGETLTCSFTLQDYSPGTVDDVRENVVDVVVTDDDEDTVGDSDDSTVNAPGDIVLDQPAITNPDIGGDQPDQVDDRDDIADDRDDTTDGRDDAADDRDDVADDRSEVVDEQDDVVGAGETEVLGNVVERDTTVQAQADERELARTGVSSAQLALLALLLMGLGYVVTRLESEVG